MSLNLNYHHQTGQGWKVSQSVIRANFQAKGPVISTAIDPLPIEREPGEDKDGQMAKRKQIKFVKMCIHVDALN